MGSSNYYDVTKWQEGDPYEDIGRVLNSILQTSEAGRRTRM